MSYLDIEQTDLALTGLALGVAVRDPGVPPDMARSQLTGNIDLAPTILDAANADPGPEPVDGVSLLDPAAGAGRDLLLQNNKGSLAVRTQTHMYAEHDSGETELYDLVEDPLQLESRHAGGPSGDTYAPLQAQLAERLDQLKGCEGEGCR